MAKTSLKKFLVGYETPVYPKEDGGEINTGIKFYERSFSGNITSRKKKILTSGIARFFDSLAMIISYTGTRGYGALFLSCGLLTVIYEIAKIYFNVSGGDVVFPTVVGALLAIMSIPLLLVDKPFCIALQDFPPTDYLFFEFFSIKRMHRQTDERGIPSLVMAVFGIMLATAGIFFDSMMVFAIAVAVVAICFSFVAPEFAFFSSIILLPASPFLENGMTVLASMIVAAFISFMRKVVFGKRIFSIEQYDIVITVLMFVILTVGIFIRGIEAFESSLWLVLFSLGYSLASNLLTNRRLAESAICAVLVSSVMPLIFTVLEVALLLIDKGITALLDYSAKASFSTDGAYAAFLLLAIFSSAYFISTVKRKSVRARYIFMLILNMLALLLTKRFDAVIALIAGLVAYKIMRRGRALAPLAAVAAFVPLVLFLLPEKAFDTVFADFGTAYTRSEYLELWRASFDMFKSRILTGIGIGADSFASEIGGYGQIVSENSSNLFMEIACEAGAFALLTFLLLLLVRFLHRTVYREYIAESHVTHISCISAAMVTMLVAFGMTEYIWADQTLYYLFWCIFGIGSATLRLSKREHDDKVMYYGYLMTVDSSVVDVKIN